MTVASEWLKNEKPSWIAAMDQALDLHTGRHESLASASSAALMVARPPMTRSPRMGTTPPSGPVAPDGSDASHRFSGG